MSIFEVVFPRSINGVTYEGVMKIAWKNKYKDVFWPSIELILPV